MTGPVRLAYSPRNSVGPGTCPKIGNTQTPTAVTAVAWIRRSCNGVRETSRTGLLWMIPVIIPRTCWIGIGDWPSFLAEPVDITPVTNKQTLVKMSQHCCRCQRAILEKKNL